MPSVCVGCGLKIDGGVLALDLDVATGFVDLGATWPDASGADTIQLAIIAPSASSGPENNVGTAVTELAALEVVNDSDCRPMTCFITAHGRTRMDVRKDNILISTGNVAQNEIRVNGGAWRVTDLSAYAQDAGEGSRHSVAWNHHATIPPVVVPPLGTLTIDRRARFRWETNLITNKVFWNLPSISVIGF
jgi:hypothetical protein